MENNQKIQKCFISIIIPVFNCEDCIDRCIKSIYAQSFSNFELILVNDGSKDGSLEKCRWYEKEDTRITVINKENGGAGSARNAGLQVAKGEYILFIDADDEIDKELLSVTYSKAKEADYDMVVFAVDIVSPDHAIQNETGRVSTKQMDLVCHSQSEFRNSFVDLYYGGVLFGGPINKLYKRRLILDNDVIFPDLKRGQDEIFNFRFYKYVNTAVIIPNVLYTYYIYDQSSANRKYRLENFETSTITYLKTIKALLEEFNLKDVYSIEKFQNSFVYAMSTAPNLAWNPIEKLSKNEKIEFISKVQNHPFIEETTATIRFIPKECKDFWKCFLLHDAKQLYRFIVKKKIIRATKDFIKKCIGR